MIPNVIRSRWDLLLFVVLCLGGTGGINLLQNDSMEKGVEHLQGFEKRIEKLDALPAQVMMVAKDVERLTEDVKTMNAKVDKLADYERLNRYVDERIQLYNAGKK